LNYFQLKQRKIYYFFKFGIYFEQLQKNYQIEAIDFLQIRKLKNQPAIRVQNLSNQYIKEKHYCYNIKFKINLIIIFNIINSKILIIFPEIFTKLFHESKEINRKCLIIKYINKQKHF
jgi:hypothetical protein